MRKAIVLITISFLLSTLFVSAQNVQNLPALKQKQPYDNVAMQVLKTDSTFTSTVIWIKQEVKPHYHASHTEQVYVIEGTGQMLVGNDHFDIGPGDLITIPKGTIHALRVTSKDKPMKVLSIQTPQFDGSDRVMVEKSGW
jgi:mannose-6-phosphate isomerase-like protein (cupin superfamily)